VITTTNGSKATALPFCGRPSHAVARIARRIFDELSAMHGLGENDAELLSRAVAGLRFVKSARGDSSAEHILFRAALADLGNADAWTVEAAACFAADQLAPPDLAANTEVVRRSEFRAFWLAAVLRLADALCGSRDAGAPHDAYAAWTEDTLYLEFDSDDLDAAAVERARGRVAALELLACRRVVLARSCARRGVA